jgi:hypothetical protein
VRTDFADRRHGCGLEEEKPSPNPLPHAGEGNWNAPTSPASGRGRLGDSRAGEGLPLYPTCVIMNP